MNEVWYVAKNVHAHAESCVTPKSRGHFLQEMVVSPRAYKIHRIAKVCGKRRKSAQSMHETLGKTLLSSLRPPSERRGIGFEKAKTATISEFDRELLRERLVLNEKVELIERLAILDERWVECGDDTARATDDVGPH